MIGFGFAVAAVSLGFAALWMLRIFDKLRLPPSGTDHRCVPAVLAYLREVG